MARYAAGCEDCQLNIESPDEQAVRAIVARHARVTEHEAFYVTLPEQRPEPLTPDRKEN